VGGIDCRERRGDVGGECGLEVGGVYLGARACGVKFVEIPAFPK